MQTTRLTGLAVAKHPHQTLKILYEKTLRTLQKMPATASYRKYTEQIINERMHLVKTEPELTKLEHKINSGQLEEVILQAERELMLSRKMLAWKPWEPLKSEAPADQWKWPLS
ncbi:NADH dehydrogenase [ubiquinone] 1 alpha subcomplex subunit 5-like isoform X2 [Gigantopelta aegis]|uniref:NADH dehydrogenase [ubiquinone] 1 alpha subcomplex subunit 5-like isoform X2 n=1 Tax=Gigantopelta aegis TaxID=1735272 RepID=UPI001B88BFBC|nr:NADH dehydrogenase [ubiquinone] 1 alpha subcomplex subunit 5-like isoform X2 [Gigantopelta aegis]